LGAGSIACSEAICSYIVYLSSFALSGGCPGPYNSFVTPGLNPVDLVQLW
jgi:hypothetical protein